jgi:hypothetical protein
MQNKLIELTRRGRRAVLAARLTDYWTFAHDHEVEKAHPPYALNSIRHNTTKQRKQVPIDGLCPALVILEAFEIF